MKNIKGCGFQSNHKKVVGTGKTMEEAYENGFKKGSQHPYLVHVGFEKGEFYQYSAIFRDDLISVENNYQFSFPTH